MRQFRLRERVMLAVVAFGVVGLIVGGVVRIVVLHQTGMGTLSIIGGIVVGLIVVRGIWRLVRESGRD